jgi:hypothetical protein
MAVDGGAEPTGDGAAGEGFCALLMRVVPDLKDSMHSMTLESADAFASHVEASRQACSRRRRVVGRDSCASPLEHAWKLDPRQTINR